jgi:hypothetical protein
MLQGKTVGLIGSGAIARGVARLRRFKPGAILINTRAVVSLTKACGYALAARAAGIRSMTVQSFGRPVSDRACSSRDQILRSMMMPLSDFPSLVPVPVVPV